MSGKKHSYSFSSIDLLTYVWRKRNILIIVSVIAAVLSIIASLMITPMFKSRVIMFATTNANISKSLLYENQTNFYAFGEKEQAEQLLLILNSTRIRDRIIEKYNLMEHYEIDPESKFPYTRLYKVFRSHISFMPTEYTSIRIEVTDKDPQMAANIANDIAALVDTVYNEIKMTRAEEAIKIVENQYLITENKVKELKDSIQEMGRMGVSEYRIQIDRYSEGYAYAIKEGAMGNAKILENKINKISEYSGTYITLLDRLNFENEMLSRFKQRLLEAQIETTTTIPHVFIVDKAYKAEKKYYPKKSLIVSISTLSVFLLTLILLIINDFWNDTILRRKK